MYRCQKWRRFETSSKKIRSNYSKIGFYGKQFGHLLYIIFLTLFFYLKAKFLDFKIQNMVGSCDVKFPIRLEGLVLTHGKFSSYEPELFPGLIYRMVKPRIVLLIFVSGKVVLTGAKVRQEIYDAFDNIYPILKSFKKQWNFTLLWGGIYGEIQLSCKSKFLNLFDIIIIKWLKYVGISYFFDVYALEFHGWPEPENSFMGNHSETGDVSKFQSWYIADICDWSIKLCQWMFTTKVPL